MSDDDITLSLSVIAMIVSVAAFIVSVALLRK